MKRILLTFLAVILAAGLFASVGYTGYRLGYARGVQTTANGDGTRPGLRLFDEFDRRGIMPGREPGFGRGFERRVSGLPMIGFGYFQLLVPIVLLILLTLFACWLFTRSGWSITREPLRTASPPPASGEEAAGSNRSEN